MGNLKTARRQRLKYSIRKKVNGTPARPRLTVYRSNTNLYAQVVDDEKGVTLVSASTVQAGEKKWNSNLADATEVGKKIAEKAKAAGIETVVFDRSGYLYHGKIKALADGAREGGLKF